MVMKLHHAKQEGLRKELIRRQLAPHAASVLMKYCLVLELHVLTYSGRSTVWRGTSDDDKKLHHLMCYIHRTKHWRMIGWVGDSVEDLCLAVYADADFSGCADSLRSTSGGHMNLQGPNTRFPLSGSSKRQGSWSFFGIDARPSLGVNFHA